MKAAPDGTWSGNIFEIGGESIGFKNLLPKGYFVICASEGGDDQLFFECIANLEVDTLVSSDELVTVHASSEPSITLVPIEGDLSSIARGLAIL